MPPNFVGSWSLKSRITVLTLAVFLISIWSLSFYASRMLREDMQRVLAEQQFSTVSFMALQISDELTLRLTSLESWAAGRMTPAILADDTAMQTRLEGSPTIQGLFNGGIWITRRDGIAIASVPPARIGTNFMDREYIAAALKQGKSTISSPIIGKVSNVPSFAISVPIRDPQGNVIGVLVGVTELDKPNFLDKISNGLYGKTGGYTLIDYKQRLIITGQDRNRIMSPLPPKGRIRELDRFVDGYNGTQVYLDPLGIELLASTKTIPNTTWYLGVTLPTAEAFAPIQDMQRRIVLASIFLTLMAGVITWWLLRRQLEPMVAAASALALISDTNQIPEPLPIARHDEVGKLIGGFNRVLETLGKREKALNESEERWKFAIEGSGDGVWDWNLETGEATFSKRWKEMLGFAENEIENQSEEWVKRVHPEDLPGVMAKIQEHLDGKIASAIVEYRMLAKDGSWKWMLGRGIVVRRDAEGKPLRLVGTNADITERKQAEATRTKLEAQLRESQKMEALGTLAGGVAHDFNNALAAIIGNAELARQDVGPEHAALESLEEIGKASRRAKALVQQILAFGRRQTTERKVISLEPVVQESVKFLRATIPAGVSLNVACAPDAPSVLADVTQIEQILINLSSNAWHAIESQERAGLIEIQLEAEVRGDQRFAVLTVRDNGKGMDDATRARIFEPFFTTKSVDKGTGLGLSVVYGIAQAHEAGIEVRSTPGEGTAFVIRFAAAQVSVERAPARNEHASDTDAGEQLAMQSEGKRVLYVDDEKSIVSLMTRLLGRRGYRVTGYSEPRKALEAVRANPDQFDLAVTDYNMPGMSGLEVAIALREIRADLPIILISGYITEELQRDAPAAGVQELIFKADAVEEVCAAVARFAHAQSATEISS